MHLQWNYKLKDIAQKKTPTKTGLNKQTAFRKYITTQPKTFVHAMQHFQGADKTDRTR